MLQTDIIQTLLKDSRYHLELFTEAELAALRERILTQTVAGKPHAFVTCAVRNRPMRLKPEELIRQLYVQRLVNHYGYTKDRLALEYPVNFGRETKRADIVIVDKARPDTAYIIIEVKKPNLLEGKAQLRSYCNATGAPIGVWTNGQHVSHYHRKEPNYFEEITDIPRVNQTLSDILSERWTLKDLVLKDKLASERKTLKEIILELEDEVLANAGVDVFEEVFKLIFTKLYDECERKDDKTKIEFYLEQHLDAEEQSDSEKVRECLTTLDDSSFDVLEFRNTGQTDSELKAKMQQLFKNAGDRWRGVFPEGSTFELSDSHLAVCVASLQDVKLFNSNLQVVDEAFEYLVSKSAKGEKGQYFTPRHVIDMCVKMLNPCPGESMIDTAAGSCGFPVHTIFKLTGNLFTAGDIAAADKPHIRQVFGIDFDEKTVRVARTLNLIAGDGEANVLHLNTLDYERWSDWTERDKQWIITYSGGFQRLAALRAEPGGNQRFHFDILMANPPFAGDIKESRILHRYRLGLKPNGRAQAKVKRDILFIERNLDFLKPGGRMAIVLPQGRFNNPSDKYIRDFIAERARILAVVGLDINTFKPHTGTKTSVLFVQKWNDNPADGPLCPKMDDYPIFFAVSEKGGKDTSGDYIYLENGDGNYKLDKNRHLIVEHNLHNHDGELPDGIAESFVAWAKRENLSFWQSNDVTEWMPIPGLTFEKNYVDVRRAARIDADYFQPKYDDIVNAIKDYPGGWETLGNLVQLKDTIFKPASDTEYRYIELANIGANGEITGCTSARGQDLPSRARHLVRAGDVIVSSIEGSLESIALVTEEYDGALCSTGFHVISSDVLNSETLFAFLRSRAGHLQLKKGCSGTILTAISKSEFRKVVLPKITAEKQAEIQQQVAEAVNLRRQSNALIERSTQAVDITIVLDANE